MPANPTVGQVANASIGRNHAGWPHGQRSGVGQLLGVPIPADLANVSVGQLTNRSRMTDAPLVS